MQAIMVSEPGGPEVLRVGETDIPRPDRGEVLVRVLAAGVGPWDAYLRRGGWSGPWPYIPGAEFAGLVEGHSGDEAGFHDGEPVYGYPSLTGCYAQYVTCPAERLAAIPAGLAATDAAAVPVDGLTAEQGLADVLGAGAGDRVLITAAAGGMGHLAVQIARALGATVAATASPQHHEFVHKGGAAVVVDHNRLQQTGWRADGTRLPPYADGELAARWAAFGWAVSEVNGHDMAAVIRALQDARTTAGRPAVLIADTTKGKGVSYMEGDYRWHSRIPTDDELATALAELADPDVAAVEA